MRRLILALGAVSLLACGGDSTGPGENEQTAVGTWNLVTVNSASLPFLLIEETDPPYRLDVISDQFILNSNGTFTQSTTFQENDDGTVRTISVPDAGTWTQTNAALTVTFNSDGSQATLAISGDTATYSEPGFVSVYERQ